MSESNESSVDRRHSVASQAELVTDPIKLAEAEAANGLRQFDVGISIAQEAIDRAALGDNRFRLRVSTILSLHRAALAGISGYAGNFRPSAVSISQSSHQPPEAFQVPELLEDLCDYVNENWASASAIHLAAYVMWRLNWIHPFADGNGRTSRIVSYVVLMVKTRSILPGAPTIPDQIASDRRGYFAALDDADRAYREGRIDVSTMEELLGGMLARQLTAFYQSAGGKLPEDIDPSSADDGKIMPAGAKAEFNDFVPRPPPQPPPMGWDNNTFDAAAQQMMRRNNALLNLNGGETPPGPIQGSSVALGGNLSARLSMSGELTLTPDIRKLYQEMVDSAAAFQKALLSLPVGIGHNGPPEPIESPWDDNDLKAVTTSTSTLKAQGADDIEVGPEAVAAVEVIDAKAAKLRVFLGDEAKKFASGAVEEAGKAAMKVALEPSTWLWIYEKIVELSVAAHAWIDALSASIRLF